MSSRTQHSGSNPRPADPSQDDGVRVPGGAPQGSLPPVAHTQPQRQVMTMPSMNVPVLPSSSKNEIQDDENGWIGVDPDDLRMPAANILRIMKKALPAEALIHKPAKEDMERCVVEFIQFLTSEAADVASNSSRKSLSGNDILQAMENTGLGHYALALRPFLEGLRARAAAGTVDLEVEDEATAAVAAQRRRARVPTPESPPSSP